MRTLASLLIFVFSQRSICSDLSSQPRCVEKERNVWIGNDQFTADYQVASARALGYEEGTTSKLFERYGSEISRECLRCLGQATQCGRDNCFLDCLTNQQSEGCRSCITSNCIPDLLRCTGATSVAELPNPVTTSVSTEGPPRRRTRRPVTTNSPDVFPASGNDKSHVTVPEDLNRLRRHFPDDPMVCVLIFGAIASLLLGVYFAAAGQRA
jgi:hypothetical protein